MRKRSVLKYQQTGWGFSMLEPTTAAQIRAFNWKLLGDRLRTTFRDCCVKEDCVGHLYTIACDKWRGVLSVQAQERSPETNLFNVGLLYHNLSRDVVRREDVAVADVVDSLRRFARYLEQKTVVVSTPANQYIIVTNCTMDARPHTIGGFSYA